MKRKSFSVVSLLAVPSVKNSPYSSIDLGEMGTSRSSKSFKRSNADPFKNLKYSSKKTPSLRPILNRHRKSPSCESLESQDKKTERPSSNSVSHSKCEHSLPSIFTRPKPFKKSNLINLQLARQKIPQNANREISTPYFMPHPSESIIKLKPEINHKSRARFFDNNRHKIQPDISFGERSNKYFLKF